MCKAKRYNGSSNPRIDTCMIYLIKLLNRKGIKTWASCCGHGKYPMTIVSEHQGITYEILSNKPLFRKDGRSKWRNFYKRDKQGYYYIPETVS